MCGGTIVVASHNVIHTRARGGIMVVEKYGVAKPSIRISNMYTNCSEVARKIIDGSLYA